MESWIHQGKLLQTAQLAEVLRVYDPAVAASVYTAAGTFTFVHACDDRSTRPIRFQS